MSRNIQILFTILIASILAYFVLKAGFQTQTNFTDLALGHQSARYVAKQNELHIQYVEQDSMRFFDELKRDYFSPRTNNILILGNSQTHSINQYQNGEVNYVQILADSFKNSDKRIFCQSIPNANLEEFYLLYKYWTSKVIFKQIIIPLFMDDLRETEIRKDFIGFLLSQHYRINRPEDQFDREINQQLNSFLPILNESGKTNIDNAALHQTVQENVEKNIDNWLEVHSTIFLNRANTRGDILVKLYNLRNTAFGINAASIRKMIPAIQKRNYTFFEKILIDARKQNLKVIVYIPPIRDDVAIPYDLGEYKSFKSYVEIFCHANNCDFLNLENLVPGNYWGQKFDVSNGNKQEIDYMHFQYKGHQLIADTLYKRINLNRR